MSLRDQILAADDLPREPVDVPWTTEKLYVRGMTADERDDFMAKTMGDGDFRWHRGITALLVCRTLVDEEGVRVLEDSDAPALGEKSGAVLAELYGVAARLSGLVAEEADLGLSEPSTTD